ncbi:MAG: MATE family efflux transporter [Bulleidia sp.]
MREVKDEQYIRMTETPVSKLIITLGIPTIISMLVTSIYNMADTYFVGTLGTSASGATGVVFGLMAILQAFGFMYGHGAGSNIAIRLGSHEDESARVFSATSFWLSIATGVVICILGMVFMTPLMRIMGSTDTILPYASTYAFYILLAGPAMTSGCVMNNILRYEGKAFYAMIGLTSGGILNIFLDFLMVRVLQLGIGGAGLATCISQYVSMAILSLPYLRRQTISSFHIRYIAKEAEPYQRIVANGMPSLCRQGLNSVSTMVLNTSAAAFGDPAVAAISIVNRIVNFLFCIAIGIGQGFQPVSSFNHGARLHSRVKAGFFFAMKLGAALLLVLAVCAFTNASTLVTFFRDDAQVISIGERALKAQSLSLIMTPITLYANMLFQSIGSSRKATFLAALRSGLVLIPVVFTMTRLFQMDGLVISQAVSEVISALITVPFIITYFRNMPEDGMEYDN